MEQNTNYGSGIRILPTGPYSILRVIATERSPDSPSEITAIATIDVMLDDLCCHFGEVTCATFGRRTGGCLSEAPACMPADLVRAVWEPFPPDLLVSHDLSMQALAFPRAITGVLPWIGTLRVARTAWKVHQAHLPGEILAARRLDDLGIEPPGEEPFRPAVREVLQVASLVDAMVASPDVRWWASSHASGAHALRPVLGEFHADYALQGMLDLTAAAPVSPSELPGPWDDDEAWRALPLDDLLPYAGSAGDGSDGLAAAEVRRRTAGLGPADDPPLASVLLRRVRFDIPEIGRCDGW